MSKKEIYLRQAGADDVQLFFQWVNEPAVRENSFNTEPIPWETHQQWFAKTLADDGVRIYVLMADNLPVGQVRLAFEHESWQISYSIATAFRGQGYGKMILQLAENELIRDGHIGESLLAEVKMDNIASKRIFSKLGYQEVQCRRSNAYAYVKEIGIKELTNVAD